MGNEAYCQVEGAIALVSNILARVGLSGCLFISLAIAINYNSTASGDRISL
ncbi:MAG: hypothetical protein F6J93_07345 [Oscillatoria sp. SIO1A7]|nr:hypothetical protein [Oscillatoria sp. SIO1A7]